MKQPVDESNVKSILILRPGGMGDIILSTPAFTALRAHFPKAHITLLTNPTPAPLFKEDPRLSEVLAFSRENIESAQDMHKAEMAALKPVFLSRNYDLAVDIRGSDFSSRLACLSGARWRVGFHSLRRGAFLGLRYNLRARPPEPSTHRVELARAVLTALGIKADPSPKVYVSKSSRTWTAEFSAKARLKDSPVIAVQPGASDPQKCWPLEDFYQICRGLMEFGAHIIVLGTRGQRQAEGLAALGEGQFISAVGAATLSQLAGLIEACDLFLGNDSGPMHLACAVGTPVAALFSTTNPERYGPVGDEHQVFTRSTPIEKVLQGIVSRLKTSAPRRS